MFELRPYQEQCISRIVKCYKKNNSGRELVVLPTGAGKTLVFGRVIAALGVSTLIMAHRDELLEHAADTYRMIKPDAIIGKVGGGEHEYSDEVTVAMINTISRPERIKMLQAMDFKLVIIDEAHHSAAESYQKVLEALPDAFILMVTATADRLDGKDIIEKDPLFSCSIIDMIEQGYLCDVRAIAIATDTDLDGIHTKMGDYNKDELDLAVNTPERNRRVVDGYSEHANGRTAICFGVTVNHAEALSDAFNEAGIPASCVTGKTPLLDRREMYKALASGAIKVLTNVEVLTEGFDCPRVDCVIMARPTQSRSLYVQSVGRGLRTHPGKQDCLILDLTDNCMKHRLVPQNLSKAIGKPLKAGKSIKQTAMIEEDEERQKQARNLHERRLQDVRVDILLAGINLFGKSQRWEPLEDGGQEMRFQKNVVRVKRSPKNGLYYVVERDDYRNETRVLIADVSAQQAQAAAEERVQEIANGIERVVARKQEMEPATPKQLGYLRRHAVAHPRDCSKAQAGELISKYIQRSAK